MGRGREPRALICPRSLPAPPATNNEPEKFHCGENEGEKSGEMRECKEKWQLCLAVSVHVHYGSLVPGLIRGIHEIWQVLFPLLSGFLPECCYYGPKYHFSVRWWTSWVRKCTAQSISKGFLLKSTYIFSSLLLTSGFDDVCPIIMLGISFQKASCRMCCMNLSWCSFCFWEILQSSAQTLQVRKTVSVFSSLAAGRWMYPVAI